MQQFKIKQPKRHKWILSKREFGQYKRMYELEVKYEDFLNYLDGLHEYYLNELGSSINLNRKTVKKELAQYMWAQTDKIFQGEPLSVWMHQKGNGEFNKFSIGTRTVFDKEIVNNHQK